MKVIQLEAITGHSGRFGKFSALNGRFWGPFSCCGVLLGSHVDTRYAPREYAAALPLSTRVPSERRLDATVRFSPEYYAVVRGIQAWTAQHGRPLYATYSED
jgi:hypothetical protein